MLYYTYLYIIYSSKHYIIATCLYELHILPVQNNRENQIKLTKRAN